MTLRAECASPSDALRDELTATLRAVTKLGGNVELVGAGLAAERRQGDRRRR